MRNKYETEFLDLSSKLDALTQGHGEITKRAREITETQDETQTVAFLSRIYKIAEEQKDIRVENIVKTVKESLIRYYGHHTISKMYSTKIEEQNEKSLSELLEELHSLIGLENVKRQVDQLIAYQRVQKLRKEHGLYAKQNTLHLAFLGNPGTGKTTVARIVGRIYKQLGLLSKGHFLEVSRTDLIAGYQGQTAIKVREVIERSKGGVLFIDEAYSITENDNTDSYGRECLTELTKALEDYREDLVVIVAGYTDLMYQFLEANPGLKSRFNTFLEFDDYNAIELEEIFIKICKDNDYTLGSGAQLHVRTLLDEEVAHKNASFGNGRLVRNLYDKLVMNHAERIAKLDTPTKLQLSQLELEDCREVSIEA